MQNINLISLIVDDYDVAIDHYVNAFGFELKEDTVMDAASGKRWVVVQPPGSASTALLLAKAKNAAETAAIGNQSGGRVFLFLDTDDFWRDHQQLTRQGVEIAREPSTEEFGVVCVLKDRYGNLWDLVQRNIPGSA